MSASSAIDRPRPVIGEHVEGIDEPVVNERAVRASAGILFIGGFAAWMLAVVGDDIQPLRTFGAVALIEMYVRLFVGTRFTPSLIVGTLITRRQRPEWVDARPKRLAWYLGFGMAFASCLSLGLLGLPEQLAVALCGVCLALLAAEAAFGICVGCVLAQRFSRRPPTRCAGDTCAYTPPRRGQSHRVEAGTPPLLSVTTTEKATG